MKSIGKYEKYEYERSGKYQYDEWQISMSMSKKKYDKYENEPSKVRA